MDTDLEAEVLDHRADLFNFIRNCPTIFQGIYLTIKSTSLSLHFKFHKDFSLKIKIFIRNRDL